MDSISLPQTITPRLAVRSSQKEQLRDVEQAMVPFAHLGRLQELCAPQILGAAWEMMKIGGNFPGSWTNKKIREEKTECDNILSWTECEWLWKCSLMVGGFFLLIFPWSIPSQFWHPMFHLPVYTGWSWHGIFVDELAEKIHMGCKGGRDHLPQHVSGGEHASVWGSVRTLKMKQKHPIPKHGKFFNVFHLKTYQLLVNWWFGLVVSTGTPK